MMQTESDEKKQKVDEMTVGIKLKELLQGLSWAEQRSITVSDEFIRLEVQIAAVFVTFSSLFLDNFQKTDKLFEGISDQNLFFVKIAFASSLISLLVSLLFGLLHLKSREYMCDKILIQRIGRYNMWEKVAQGKATVEEAEAFHLGSKLGNGSTVAEPSWTWILQTIFLMLGVAGLFLLALIFLFS